MDPAARQEAARVLLAYLVLERGGEVRLPKDAYAELRRGGTASEILVDVEGDDVVARVVPAQDHADERRERVN